MQTHDHIWYASYGSNLSKDRFYCYIMGGRPQGAEKIYVGCRDKTPPVLEKPVILHHELYFAKSSRTWQNGGVGFVRTEPDTSVQTRGNMYLITKEQFCDVIKQEIDSDETITIDFERAIRDKKYIFKEDSWYGNLLYIRDLYGYPIFTFTNEISITPTRRPSEDYLKMIIDGLLQTHHLTQQQIVEYISTKDGVKNNYSIEQLNSLYSLVINSTECSVQASPPVTVSSVNLNMSASNSLPSFGPEDYEKTIEANFKSFLESASIPLPILGALILALFSTQEKFKAFGFEVSKEFGAQLLGMTVIGLSVYFSRCLQIMDRLYKWLEKYHRDNIDTSKIPAGRVLEYVYGLQIPIILKVRNNPSIFNIFMLPVEGSNIRYNKYLGIWSFSLLFGISTVAISFALFGQNFNERFQLQTYSSIDQWINFSLAVFNFLLIVGLFFSYGLFHRSALSALSTFVGTTETKVRSKIFMRGLYICIIGLLYPNLPLIFGELGKYQFIPWFGR